MRQIEVLQTMDRTTKSREGQALEIIVAKVQIHQTSQLNWGWTECTLEIIEARIPITVENPTDIEANDMTGAVATAYTLPKAAFLASPKNQEPTIINLNPLFEPEQGFLLIFYRLDHLILPVGSASSISWPTKTGY